MFSQLFDVVFPALGDVFGTICGLASTPLSTYLQCFADGGSIVYTNLFTGVQSSYWINANFVFDGAMNLAFFGVPSNYALWLACLYNVVRVYFVTALIRFII